MNVSANATAAAAAAAALNVPIDDAIDLLLAVRP